MEKKICAYIFAVTFITLSSIVHGQSSMVQRGPSVEPIVEVDIEDAKKAEAPGTGYNFASEDHAPVSAKARVPANIVSNSQAAGPSTYIGPFIFLIALPFGIWIMISKKFSNNVEDKKVDYYPKTTQFKPYQTDYQKSAEDDDDMDFPKAS